MTLTQGLSLARIKLEFNQLQGCYGFSKKELPVLQKRTQDINFKTLPVSTKSVGIQTTELVMPIDASPQDYVDAFNTYPEHCAELRKDALEAMTRYRQAAWTFQNGIKVIPEEKEFVSKREAFYTFYHCDDHEVQETALLYLTELLENDPMSMETAKGLIAHFKNLMNEAKVKNSEYLNVLLQYRLIKACGRAAECYCLQFFQGHLGTVLPETKNDIKQAVKEIASLNKHDHPGIRYWSRFIAEAASIIETNEPNDQQWYKAAAVLFSSAKILLPITELAADMALVANGDVMALFNVPTHFRDLMSTARDTANKWNELFQLYNQIRGPQSWFRKTLTLRRMSRYALHNPESFKGVAAEFKKLKAKGTSHPEQLFGAVNDLKSNVLHSSVAEIREDNLTMILQYLRTDDPDIELRAVMALMRIADSNNLQLSNTAYVIVNLLQASKSLRFRGSQESLEACPHILSIQNSKARKITKKNVHLSSIIYFMREVADTNCELDNWGHPIPALLAILLMTADDESMIALLLHTIGLLFPKTGGTDHLGYTPYHLALRPLGTEKDIWRDEPNLIRHVAASGLPITVDQPTGLGETALHLATKGKCVRSMRYFLRVLKANPDLQDKDGNVPLHHCVMLGEEHWSAASLLITMEASLTPENNDGYTPLRLAIDIGEMIFVDLFIQHDPALYDVAFKAAIFMGHENALMYLIEQKARWLETDRLDPTQTSLVLKTISQDGIEISCSEEFAEFQMRRCEQNEAYASSFPRFAWPMLYETNDKKLSLTKLDKNPSFCRNTTDAFGNTALMQGVSKKRKVKSLRPYFTEAMQIDATNHFAQTALLIAVIHRNKKAIQLLREHGANPTIGDLEAVTPLHVAAYLRDYDLCSELLQFPEIDLDRQDISGDTPLLIACGNIPSRTPELHIALMHKKAFTPAIGYDSDEILKALIEKGADPYKTDNAGNNALHKALCYGSATVREYLIRNYRDLFWLENNQGLIPLEASLLRTHPQGLKDTGETTDDTDPIGTALIMACDGDWNIIDQQFRTIRPQLSLGNTLVEANNEKLLEKHLHLRVLGVNLPLRPGPHRPLSHRLGYSKTDNRGNTLLHQACEGRHIPIIDFLAHRVPLNKKNKEGLTPIMLAVKKGYFEVARHLWKKWGAALVENDNRDCYITHLILENKELDNNAIRFLESVVQAYPHLIRKTDNFDRTPLHVLTENNHEKSVDIILRYLPGGNKASFVWAKDGKGETALEIASPQLGAKLFAFSPKKLGDLAPSKLKELQNRFFR